LQVPFSLLPALPDTNLIYFGKGITFTPPADRLGAP
jgi:hypothetical protein